MDKLLNLIFPPKCRFCSWVGDVICKKCLNKCEISAYYSCITCGNTCLLGKTHSKCIDSTTPLSLLSIFSYKGIVRQAIKASKYNNKEFALLRALTHYGLNLIVDYGYMIERDFIVVPMPISKARTKERGFNQAAIIADILKKKFSLGYENKVLFRVKNTRPQYSNNRYDRFENVRNAFKLKSTKRLAQKKILLVDDISTSGATLLEACKALYSADPLEVHCFTLAKKDLDA